MPYVVGQSKAKARNQVRIANFTEFEEEESDQDKGKVIESDPRAGAVQQGDRVTLFVSNGQTKVPNVVGQQPGQAEDDPQRRLHAAYATT